MPELALSSTTILHDGIQMPLLGLGVFNASEGGEVVRAVRCALDAGYRSIDTASIYGNEAGVGRAVRESGIPREAIFITTKLWNADQGYESAFRACDKSLSLLGLEYIDLYLIHWPKEGRFKPSWRAMEEMRAQGKCRSIGVSNFLPHHIDALTENSGAVPSVNQVEFHPRLQSPALLAYCREKDIRVEAWSPIMRGEVLRIPELREIGRTHRKNAVQVTLRWMLQKGIVTIPKSSHRKRIIENADLYDFSLTEEEMAIIDGLDTGGRMGAHPDHVDF